jgi:hypothetical protein
MNFLEELLEYFDEEVVSSGLEPEMSASDFAFSDLNSDRDFEAILKIQEEYDLSPSEAEEFLEVTQSIQHSIGEELADIETLTKIDDYVDTFNAQPERLIGLINNVKGIYGEHEVIEALQANLTNGEIVVREYATNTPDTDLKIFDADGSLKEQIQVKISNDPHYILHTREGLSEDIKIVTNDEVLEKIIEIKGELPDGIEGIGISGQEITDQVARTLSILNETEPEFEMLIQDPVISEQLAYASENPFEEQPRFGRQVHADKRYKVPIRWVYSGSAEETMYAAAEWDPAGFEGVGNPIAEAEFYRPQTSPVSCAVVTQRNILESLTGHSFTEEDLMKYATDKGVFDPKTGTLSTHISAILRDCGFDCIDYSSASFEMIEASLRDGHKVMVGIDGNEIWSPLRDALTQEVLEQENLYHCLQVTGVDYSDPQDIKVILSDSGVGNGAMNAVSLKDFLSAWEDADNRLAIIGRKI